APLVSLACPHLGQSMVQGFSAIGTLFFLMAMVRFSFGLSRGTAHVRVGSSCAGAGASRRCTAWRTSAVYRQSSTVTAAHKQLDSNSAMLSCMPLTGFDAEFLYETMLLTFSMNSTLNAW